MSHHYKEALSLYSQGKLQQAEDKCHILIQKNPNDLNAIILSGTIMAQTGRLKQALNFFNKGISINNNNADLHYFHGLALFKLNRLEESIASYDRAIHINKLNFESYISKANALIQLNKPKDALDCLNQAIDFGCRNPLVYYNKGLLLQNLKLFELSIGSYKIAISLDEKYLSAYNNLGNIFRELKKYELALDYYNKAIELNPDFAIAWCNKGNVLFELRRFDEAIIHLNKAINLQPQHAIYYENRGNVFLQKQQIQLAILDYEKSLNLDPESKFLLGKYQYAKMCLSDWSDFFYNSNKIKSNIELLKKISDPFPTLSLLDEPEIRLLAAKLYTEDQYPDNKSLGNIKNRTKKNKIRIGYFSSDFCEHPLAYLMAELFELHDKNNFEIYAFSLSRNKNKDSMKMRLIPAFNKFIEVDDKSDEEIAMLSRELKIDLAIDLMGHTENNRFKIFSFRAAPIQINFLGYLGTSGANYIDYIIADKNIIPKNFQKYYNEKILYINNYQPNDRLKPFPKKIFTRSELKLPSESFVFCCFNNSYKITPIVFDSWMRILSKVENSVLFLNSNNDQVEINLKKEALNRNVDSERIVFAKRAPREDYLSRYHNCDLFLDTTPYNAGTTASDALWMGLPVLTMQGKSFSSRVCSSVLNSIGLNELITNTFELYESKAIEIANNQNYLKELKEKIHRNKFSTLLFDTNSFAKDLEEGYIKIFNRHAEGLKPEHIEIR